MDEYKSSFFSSLPIKIGHSVERFRSGNEWMYSSFLTTAERRTVQRRPRVSWWVNVFIIFSHGHDQRERGRDLRRQLHSKIHLRWLVGKKWELRLDYVQFKSIVESKANVKGVGTWDSLFIQKFTTYSFKSIWSALSRLFVVDPYKANNYKNDDYCLNLHWLVAKKRELRLPTALSRSLRVRPTWTGPETTTSCKNSLRTALSRSLRVKPTWTVSETTTLSSFKFQLHWLLKNGNYYVQL